MDERQIPAHVLVSESLRLGNCCLMLDWLRRGKKNQLADDLYNIRFDSFDLNQRVRWKPFEQSWHMLSDFLVHVREFHDAEKEIRNTGRTKEEEESAERRSWFFVGPMSTSDWSESVAIG